MCSTFKAMAVAAVLKKSMKERDFLQKQLSYTKAEVIASGYAPITEKHLAKGMPIADLCAAAMQYSDNAAVNLLMKELGGPKAITAFARTIGDKTFSLDRWEPALNSAIPGDVRDTSSPAAMGKSLHLLLRGEALAPLQRELFITWLKGNTTGDTRIRAGAPKDWLVGDKTGTCSYGTTNDIGIIWPPQGDPLVMAIYFTQKNKDAANRSDVIAAVTKLVIADLHP
jgi:beta-lactamase class A